MKQIPSISSELNEIKIKNLINKQFNHLGPYYYKLISEWFITAYSVFHDIDKYMILIYIINKDFIFYRRNGIELDFETFYKPNKLEVEKINLINISKDLRIAKETVRRKVSELEKSGVIKKTGKKMFVDRTAYLNIQPKITLRNLSILLSEFSKSLKNEKIIENEISREDVAKLLKKNFSFCWYQFYKFLFAFLDRWKKQLGDLEIFCIGIVIMLNAASTKEFRLKEMSFEKWRAEVSRADKKGVNAMSISEITKIPRPTVVRKLSFLIKNKYISINDKKQLMLNIRGKTLNESSIIQDENLKSLSNCIFRIFNQINLK